ncbi:hypothetical protein ACFLQL_02895 [Verrucomicrobiota bacterium]
MVTNASNDIKILRELAKQYTELANKPVQEERRRLWAAHFSLKKTRPPIIVLYGMYNVWCREVFGDRAMRCADPFYRAHERELRMKIFHDSIGDDFIMEPWLTQNASVRADWESLWGLKEGHSEKPMEGGSWKFKPPLKDWSDLSKIKYTRHEIDETETRLNVERINDAVGDILPIDVTRRPIFSGLTGDISTKLAALRGLEQIMIDMYESPKELHKLLALMRDGILMNNAEAERAGHYSLTTQSNQAMPYTEELERPRPNSGPRKRKNLWGFCAAQEFTLVSPAFHEEFLIRYQLPICEHFGLVHYGCCENLTRKIDILRSFKNLRSIAVTPTADVKECAEQIGRDYAISWRPNPTDMVCTGWDETRIHRIIKDGLHACRNGFVHVNLKDIETVQGDVSRLARWTDIVRGEIDRI